jgi:hypothetical protein
MIEVVWICVQPGAPDGPWHQDGGRQQANKKYTTLFVPFNECDSDMGGTQVKDYDTMSSIPNQAYIMDGWVDHRSKGNASDTVRYFMYAVFTTHADWNHTIRKGA